MPKLKTHSGAAKRLKVTAKGKFKFSRAGRRHLLTGKNTTQKRSSGASYISDADVHRMRALFPYA